MCLSYLGVKHYIPRRYYHVIKYYKRVFFLIITFVAPVSSPACSTTQRTGSVDMMTGGIVLTLAACSAAFVTECVLGTH